MLCGHGKQTRLKGGGNSGCSVLSVVVRTYHTCCRGLECIYSVVCCLLKWDMIVLGHMVLSSRHCYRTRMAFLVSFDRDFEVGVQNGEYSTVPYFS